MFKNVQTVKYKDLQIVKKFHINMNVSLVMNVSTKGYVIGLLDSKSGVIYNPSKLFAEKEDANKYWSTRLDKIKDLLIIHSLQ